jgi:GxxExxY protein
MPLHVLHNKISSVFKKKSFLPGRAGRTMKGRKDMPKKFSALSSIVIGAAIEVHRTLGPGLLEKTYQQCLAHELSLNNINFKMEWPLPVEYKGMQLDCGYRVDILVEDEIILELKAVDELLGIHEAQLLTYMKLAEIDQGFLINFNVKKLKHGLKSFVF